jgi:protein-S-isoprenylcysteine O-methyltransferase Ste14
LEWIPDFEIGLWNAWIFIIPFLIYWYVGIKFVFSKRMPESPSLKRRKIEIVSNMSVIAMFGSFVYSVFVPIKLGTIWFYVGLLIYLIAIALIIISMINFITTSIDKPVTKGVYRFSRNPMFIGFFLCFLGITIACISWVYLILTLFFILTTVYLSPFEEAITLGHYGKTYKDYMEKTPKWIGLPRSKIK